MSSYDYNHNQSNASGALNGRSNGGHHQSASHNGPLTAGQHDQKIQHNQQSLYHNTDSQRNIIRNNNVSTAHELEMSVQSSRPASKTAMLVRKRRNMVEQLTCFICKGYLIDATTIDECMDSFCKSCLVKHLRVSNECPKCGSQVHETNPFSAIRSDKVLQDIVYKLVPGLYDDEMKRRREFYRGKYLSKSSSSEDEDSEESTANTITYKFPHLTCEQLGIVPHPKPFYKPTDNIDLSIEPQTGGENSPIFYDNKRNSIVTSFTGNPQPSKQPTFSKVSAKDFKTYLRCPAKFTALNLKKFIAAKFNICQEDAIHLLYLNETLKDQYSLLDIAYIYDWRGIEHMRLYYIIERNLTRQALHKYQTEGQQSTKINGIITTRQSVGTSTQTVKRVCIDPQPSLRFYEEHDQDNDLNNSCSNINGRLMRPRKEARKAPDNPSTNGVAQPPILRTTPAPATIYSTATNSQATINGPPPQIIRKSPIVSHVQQIGVQYTNNKKQLEIGLSNKQSIEPAKLRSNSSAMSSLVMPSSNHHWTPTVIDDDNELISVDSSPNHSTRIGSERYAQKPNCVPQLMTTTVGSTSTSSATKTITSLSAGNGRVESSIQSIARTGPVQATNSPKPGSRPPQLAYTIVTQRGIIVRRLHNTDGTPMTSESAAFSGLAGRLGQQSPITTSSMPQLSSKTSSSAVDQLVTGSSASTTNRPSICFQRKLDSRCSDDSSRGDRSPTQLNNLQRSSSHTSASSAWQSQLAKNNMIASAAAIAATESSAMPKFTHGQNQSSNQSGSKAGSSSSATTSTTMSTANMSTTPRHQLKVKPVYKTFVDLTKIKSPNFKKFGFPSRH